MLYLWLVKTDRDLEEKRILVGRQLAHVTGVFLLSKVCRLYNSAVREDMHSS